MKNIFLVTSLIFIAITAKAQKFAQVGIGLTTFDVVLEYGFVNGAKMIDLQYGKFTSNRGMSSVTLSYYTGATFRDKFEESFYNPISGLSERFSYNYKISVLSVGFERKVTYGYTEFDDQWNRYGILCIGINRINIKQEGKTPAAAKDFVGDFREGSRFSLNYGLGFGWARKFTVDTYGFTELRGYLQPGVNGFGSARLLGLVNFGVRKLF